MTSERLAGNAEVRQLAIELAEKCGCRTWKAHRGVAIWRFEERERLKTATR